VASIFTHGFAACAFGKIFTGEKMPPRFWAWSVACSVLPDIDSFGLAMGIEYGHWLGHRGFLHSLFFAAFVGFSVATFAMGKLQRWSGRWLALAIYFSAVTASHGVLDAVTDGGLGVAFFSPFSHERYFFPWRPLLVSPIGIVRFVSDWGGRVLWTEFVWVWLPVGSLMLAAMGFRRIRARLNARPEKE
jgi:inner membrane protein